MPATSPVANAGGVHRLARSVHRARQGRSASRQVRPDRRGSAPAGTPVPEKAFNQAIRAATITSLLFGCPILRFFCEGWEERILAPSILLASKTQRHSERPPGVKNPENPCHLDNAFTIWILRFVHCKRSRHPKHCHPDRSPHSGRSGGTCVFYSVTSKFPFSIMLRTSDSAPKVPIPLKPNFGLNGPPDRSSPRTQVTRPARRDRPTRTNLPTSDKAWSHGALERWPALSSCRRRTA